MSVIIKNMDMPKKCMECKWFSFRGTTIKNHKSYYLDARCKQVESGQDWYGEDKRGGWIGEDIGIKGYYYYMHCLEEGKRAKQCPLKEVK